VTTSLETAVGPSLSHA